MLNKIKCLLIGFGNIGKIHAKYLDINPLVEWFWYDPFLQEKIKFSSNKITSLNNLDFFDKIFILTPEDTHYSIYKQIREKYNKDIFIEKPAIINKDHFDMLYDSNLTVGLVERFNPAIATTKKNIDVNKIINIDFSRCCAATCSSPISILKDISIHDIDLFLYLSDISKIEDIKFDINIQNNTILSNLICKNILARFIWSKDTFFKERKVTIRQTDCTYCIDLQEQTVNRYFNNQLQQTVSESLFVEKSSPIDNEQKIFLSKQPTHVTAKNSHSLLLKLIDHDK